MRVGVVTFPHQEPVAIAVLTRSARSDAVLPEADKAIGAVAALCVRDLQ